MLSIVDYFLSSIILRASWLLEKQVNVNGMPDPLKLLTRQYGLNFDHPSIIMISISFK